MQYFHRFMGLTSDCKEQIERELRHVSYTVNTNDADKSVTFQLDINGKSEPVRPEQVMAFQLNKINNAFEK